MPLALVALPGSAIAAEWTRRGRNYAAVLTTAPAGSTALSRSQIVRSRRCPAGTGIAVNVALSGQNAPRPAIGP